MTNLTKKSVDMFPLDRAALRSVYLYSAPYATFDDRTSLFQLVVAVSRVE